MQRKGSDKQVHGSLNQARLQRKLRQPALADRRARIWHNTNPKLPSARPGRQDALRRYKSDQIWFYLVFQLKRNYAIFKTKQEATQ